MKLILILACVLFTSSLALADDVADAKAAFATMVEYQKTDDIHTLDLFAPDVLVTFTLTDGKATKDVIIPPAEFRESIKQEIAKKKGNKDVYENVKYTQKGASVKLTSTILYADNGKRGPFSVLYERNKDGVLKVKEMKVTIYVDALPVA